MELTDICRLFHSTVAASTFYSAVHRASSKIDHVLGHKASLNKHRKTEIICYILSNCNGIKLEISNKRLTQNIQIHGYRKKHWNDQMGLQRNKREIS
jgi:hypothetical protein